METLARLAFANAGLPEPGLNADVFDEHGGWLANWDFVWRERGTLAEYDGDQHRTDQRRWRSDHRRRRELTVAGWRVHSLTADDFANPAATRRCIADIARDLDRP
jgi:very-short-patch-repair endonuclease